MQDLLREEAGYLHRALFGTEASATFIQYYLAAHAVVPSLSEVGAAEQRSVRIVVERHLNPLAVECALRRPRGRHLLTQKLLLTNYIAECDGEHTAAFHCSGSRIRNLFAGMVVGTSGIWHHFLGRLLVKRHALV